LDPRSLVPYGVRWWHEAWTDACGGRAPRSRDAVYRWAQNGWLAQMPFECTSGSDEPCLTAAASVVAHLNGVVATITTSKQAQAAVARSSRWLDTDTSCPSPTTPLGWTR
jgi:hypothetical protein